MLKFLRLYRSLLLLNFGVIFFVSFFFNMTTPAVFKLLIEGVLPDGNFRAFLMGSAVLMAVTLGRGLFGVVQDYIFLLHRQLIEVAALRAGLGRPDLKSLNMQSAVANIRNFIGNFQYFWIEFVFFVAYAVFISAVVLAVFYLIQPAYFWLSLAFMLAHAVNFIVFRPSAERRAAQFNQTKTALIDEMGSHARILKEARAMDNVAFLQERMHEHASQYATAYRRREWINFSQRLLQDSLINTFYVAFFCFALYLSTVSTVSIGSAALSIFLSSLLFEPIYRFSAILKSYFEARQYTAWVPARHVEQARAAASTILQLTGVQTAVMAARGLTPLTMSFGPGVLHLIVGPSGCGKSTLLDCLAGVDSAANGQISGSRNVYYCEQQAAVFPGSVSDNVRFFNSAGANCASLLGALNLTAAAGPGAHNSATNLSSGQKQRLAIARSLYCDSAVALYDEPTSAQDLDNERAVFALLAEAARTRTIIVVSHSATARYYAGTILDLGTSGNLSSHIDPMLPLQIESEP